LVQAVASSPSLFDLASVYTIRNVQENQDEMESKGTHQLLVHAVNLLGENVRPTTTKKTPTPVVSSMEGDLEINAKELSIRSRLVTRCLSSSIFTSCFLTKVLYALSAPCVLHVLVISLFYLTILNSGV
jgi:hypothetical protein